MNRTLLATFLLLASCIILQHHVHGMDTTFLAPSTTIPHPRFARDDLTTLMGFISYSTAHHSFDYHHNKKALFSYDGLETLLKRFTDTSLPCNDASSVGQALVDGAYTSTSCSIYFAQNFTQHFFIEFASGISLGKLKNINVIPTDSKGRPLSPADIANSPELTQYLQDLYRIMHLQRGCNAQSTQTSFIGNSVGNSYLNLGYTTSLQHFTHLDFFDFSAQIGLLFPEKILPADPYPLFNPSGNIIAGIGVPMQLCASLGMYDWLNIGGTCTVIPFISCDKEISMATTATNNIVFMPESGLCTIRHRPFLYSCAYLQAEHFIPQLTCAAALCYAQQFATTYRAFDEQKFPTNIINRFATHRPWQELFMTLNAEYDFAREHKKNRPQVKLAYSFPLWARSLIATNVVIGSLSFELFHEF